jgi:hypothetical protein
MMEPTMRQTRTVAMTKARSWWLVAMMMAACSGVTPADQLDAGPPGRVVVRTDPASVAECSYGGSVVSSGVDDNGDGALQDIEVVTRAVVCNPAPTQSPPAIVIRLVDEPPGMHCSSGGTAVASGADQNRNGRLDDDEVAHIDYACGENLLTRLAAEPPGAHCIAGGVAFLLGRDRDDDGVLEDGEVEITEFACSDVLSRDVEIRSDADVAALANIRLITGNLIVHGETQTLSLPRLEHIGGGLAIFAIPLTEVSLPALQDIAGGLSITGGGALDFPQLRHVRGDLDIQDGTLQDLGGFPALAEVDGNARLSEMFSLRSIDLSNVSIAGELTIDLDLSLQRVTLKASDRVGAISISSNPVLEAVDVSVTPRQTATAELGSIGLTFNDTLAHVGVSADHVGSLTILSDPVLSDVSLNVARFDSDVSIANLNAPFQMALSSPSPDGVAFGGALVISAPLQSFQSSGPITVDGLCVFDKTLLPALDLRSPMLVRHGVRFSDNAQLTSISPITLVGSLQVINNAQLRSVDFVSPAAPDVLDGVVITDNPMLESAPLLASLVSVRGVVDIERNPLLGSVFGPSLTLVEGPMFIDENDSLTSLQFPHLVHLVSDLEVFSNGSLQTLEMPMLTEVRDELFIISNPQLHHIAFDALGRSDFFLVEGNPRLPTCEVLAVFAHVPGPGKSQSGNDDVASCP